jgi:thymidylate kinase
MIIAFSGFNSTGKSTLIKEISQLDILKDKDYRIKEEFNFLTNRIIYKIFNNNDLNNYKNERIIKKENKSNNNLIKLLSYLYPLFIYFELIIEYFYYERFFKRKILLRDRYAFDYLIGFRQMNLSNFFFEYLFKNFPKPLFLAYLSTSKKDTKKRMKKKGFVFPESYIIKMKEIYDDFYNKSPIIKINTSKDKNTIINNLKNKIGLRIKLICIKNIFVCGLDGSGKSTIINEFGKFLENNKIKYKIIHFYYNPIILKIIKLIKKRKSVETFYKKSISHELKVKSKTKSNFWAYLVLFDSYIQYYWGLIMYRRKLIIFDRFFYDYLVSFKFLGINIEKIKNLIPKNKTFILFLAKPEILYKRKPEHTLDFFKKNYKEYKNVGKSYNSLFIDTSKLSEEQAINRFLEVIRNEL